MGSTPNLARGLLIPADGKVWRPGKTGGDGRGEA